MEATSSALPHSLTVGKPVTIRLVTDTYSPEHPDQPNRLTREFETAYYSDLIPDLYKPSSTTFTYSQSHFYVATANTLVVYKKDIRFPRDLQ